MWKTLALQSNEVETGGTKCIVPEIQACILAGHVLVAHLVLKGALENLITFAAKWLHHFAIVLVCWSSASNSTLRNRCFAHALLVFCSHEPLQ